jgi:glycine cleavage system H protein
MNIAGFEMPEDLYYTELHTWARIDGTTATIGLDRIGIALAGKVSFVRVKKAGMKVEQGTALGTMEAGKGVVKLPAPLTGDILEVNPMLAGRQLEKVNNDPYGAGWLVKIKVANPAEKDKLLHGDKMIAWAKAEAAKAPK